MLVLRDVPEPEPMDGAVALTVRAAAINFAEVLVRQGRYPKPPELPWIPGVEVAGETDSGRRVIGLVRSSGGGYAERVSATTQWLFDLPEDASFEEGAAFLVAYLTAWIPLTRLASVRPGVRVLVHAAAGGVGTAAVVAARALGAEVIGTVGSPEKLELPRSLGATQTVTYDKLDGIEPVDVVLDPVGGELFAKSLELLRPLGVAVPLGFVGGEWPQIDPAQIVGRNIGVRGFFLERLMRRQPDVVAQAARDLLRLWEAGVVHPVVGRTFPLAEASQAHRLIEERRSTGKVVLVP